MLYPLSYEEKRRFFRHGTGNPLVSPRKRSSLASQEDRVLGRSWCPPWDSNPELGFRRPALSPISLGGRRVQDKRDGPTDWTHVCLVGLLNAAAPARRPRGELNSHSRLERAASDPLDDGAMGPPSRIRTCEDRLRRPTAVPIGVGGMKKWRRQTESNRRAEVLQTWPQPLVGVISRLDLGSVLLEPLDDVSDSLVWGHPMNLAQRKTRRFSSFLVLRVTAHLHGQVLPSVRRR